MRKYKRISSFALENKEKKVNNDEELTRPSNLDTKTLMAKLGVKIGNKEVYPKGSGFNTKKAKETNNITIFNEVNNNNNDIKRIRSNSQKKRNKNNNGDKKNHHISSSYEKRIIKKDKKNADQDLFIKKD